jgi:nicotinate-nucleotide pyrophosphorylase
MVKSATVAYPVPGRFVLGVPAVPVEFESKRDAEDFIAAHGDAFSLDKREAMEMAEAAHSEAAREQPPAEPVPAADIPAVGEES